MGKKYLVLFLVVTGEDASKGTVTFKILIAVAVLLVVAGSVIVFQSWQAGQKDAVRIALFAEIQPVKLTNCELERFGEPSDGGYLICANLLGAVQSAYSYGISGYDGWGCEASRRLHLTTHQYDCFNTSEPVCKNGATRFHAECVAPTTSTSEGRAFDTIERQLTTNGDTGKRLIVKMDIEGNEWDTFAATPEKVLRQFDQLIVEFHELDHPRFLATMRRLKQYFYIAHLHFNNWVCDPEAKPFPSLAFEILFVNKNLGILDPAGRAQLPHPLDAPNNPDLADCQTAASVSLTAPAPRR